MMLVDKCCSARFVVKSSSVCSEVGSGGRLMRLHNCR